MSGAADIREFREMSAALQIIQPRCSVHGSVAHTRRCTEHYFPCNCHPDCAECCRILGAMDEARGRMYPFKPPGHCAECEALQAAGECPECEARAQAAIAARPPAHDYQRHCLTCGCTFFSRRQSAARCMDCTAQEGREMLADHGYTDFFDMRISRGKGLL